MKWSVEQRTAPGIVVTAPVVSTAQVLTSILLFGCPTSRTKTSYVVLMSDGSVIAAPSPSQALPSVTAGSVNGSVGPRKILLVWMMSLSNVLSGMESVNPASTAMLRRLVSSKLPAGQVSWAMICTLYALFLASDPTPLPATAFPWPKSRTRPSTSCVAANRLIRFNICSPCLLRLYAALCASGAAQRDVQASWGYLVGSNRLIMNRRLAWGSAR